MDLFEKRSRGDQLLQRTMRDAYRDEWAKLPLLSVLPLVIWDVSLIERLHMH